MKSYICTILCLVLTAGACNDAATPKTASTSDAGTGARQAVVDFYQAFNNHEFETVQNFTTDDWVHINPFGGQTAGREAVLKELKEVHESFLKGVTASIDDIAVRPAGSDAAVVTVKNTMGSYTTPDGVKHENERQIKTFVVTKRNGKWLIMQDQNTIMGDK